MNIFFSTQDASLDLFHALLREIREPLNIQRAGFAVVNSVYYSQFLKRHPDFEKRYLVLKEWDVYKSARKDRFDAEELAEYERDLGDPNLWPPIVIDRRIYQGPRCTFDLDYRCRRSHEEMQRILLAGCRAFDRLFAELKPSVVMTVYTATLADSLAHLFAVKAGAINLDLRAARVMNFVMWARGFEKPPPHLRSILNDFQTKGIPDHIRQKVEAFLTEFTNRQVTYEGGTPKRRRLSLTIKNPLCVLKNSLLVLRARRTLGTDDPYLDGTLMAGIYRRLVHPVRSSLFGFVAGNRFVDDDRKITSPYVFFPLHVEPELVLARWARPWLNQIEAVRNISLSIPVTWKVVVKEHPQMMGRRPLSYYRKLLMIPNVLLYDPWASTVSAIRNSMGVFVIRGALALDAAIYGKPVICLGHSLWDMLPSHMARIVENPYKLAAQFSDLRANYRWDREALATMIAVLIAGSCPVNLVTGLLGKKDRESAGENYGTVESHPHLSVLAEYTIQRIRQELNTMDGSRSAPAVLGLSL